MNLLRQDRVVPLLAIAGVTAIAWLYLLTARQHMDMAMGDMPGMAMPFAAPWVFAMWWVMMLGMMLPGAAPMILTFGTLQRRKRQRNETRVPIVLFVTGYLLVWGAFSLAATAAQWTLQRYALLSPALAMEDSVVGGALFILAGVYQFTPLKHACLSHCRSPFAFLLNHWRDGWAGALRMGADHGLYCLGCCWLLMVLLFAAGVMNLLWVAALAALVFAEKLLPAGVRIERIGGGAMMLFGVWLLVQ
jgi:predicted metal-binding membrane protein